MPDFSPFKQSVLSVLDQRLTEKIDQHKRRIADAQTAASEDTKSSAGDKFETSREMIKQEINKIVQQLSLAEEMKEVAQKLASVSSVDTVAPGSLVHTSESWYYLSVAFGKLLVDDTIVYALSATSPLGKELIGKKKGETIPFRSREIEILNIL